MPERTAAVLDPIEKVPAEGSLLGTTSGFSPLSPSSVALHLSTLILRVFHYGHRQ
jgi:hypothetical protein